MNIDELTIGQARQLAGIFGATGRADKPPLSGRAVVVVDRGWIFAGDLSRTPDGYVRIDNCLWVFRWESVGFAAIVKDPSKADLRSCDPVEVPEDAVVFRVPVGATWGAKK